MLHRKNGIVNICEGDLVKRQRVEQATNQQGLSRTDLAGNDDKSLPSKYAVIQQGKCFVVARRRIKEIRIRANLKGIASQVVEFSVHQISALQECEKVPCQNRQRHHGHSSNFNPMEDS